MMLRQLTKISVANLAHRPCPGLWSRQHQLNASTATAADTLKDKWDLYAGVLVERLPVVSKSLNELERKFQEHLWQVEFEKSLKSNHELQHERDLHQAELLKSGKIEIDLDEASSKQTAQDLHDAYKDELHKFQFASRTTMDDEANNFASNNRKLEDTLYLLIEHKLGNKTHLLLPQGIRLDGETMRQAAERVLRERCGDNINVQFYGNAPCGFYKYKYPVSLRNETAAIGAKVFFYRASLKKGNVDPKITKNFQWLEKADLGDKLQNTAYNESVHKFLL